MPAKNIDLTKWSVVACDQYTSQRDYWQHVDAIVGDNPSTLRLIFPEVYLEDPDKDQRISSINQAMQQYLDQNILIPLGPGFIYVDRQTSRTKSRKGLMVAVDLEQYDYNKGSRSLIRATEGTVLDRLPPRIKIRENAPIELPHIMVLIDDPNKTVIEPIAQTACQLEVLYDFNLMMDGMHIKGYKVQDTELIEGIYAALAKLADLETQKAKYDAKSAENPLLFAVGDGNHSLATAKACWEKIKLDLTPEEASDHPARFALVELVNVHDEGLTFEPIHRVVFNVEPENLLSRLVEFYGSSNVSILKFASFDEAAEHAETLQKNKDCHAIPYTAEDQYGAVIVQSPSNQLEVGTLQAFLDEYISARPSVKIDYIHGKDVVTSLGSQPGNMGFYLPPMNKQDLFRTVALDGVLPRKTFSMGEAEEKRFYLECRKIRRD